MALTVEDLSFPIGAGAFVRGVFLRARPGEFVLVETAALGLGTNFLLAMAGVHVEATGRVRLDNDDLLLEPGTDRALHCHEHIALVYRRGGLISLLSVAENIALPLGYHHDISPAELGRAVHGVAQELELSHLLERNVDDLDEYQARLVDLARALIRRPRLVLIDGLLEGMPAERQRRIIRVVDAYRQSGDMTVLMTVRSATVCPHCDRLYQLTASGLKELH